MIQHNQTFVVTGVSTGIGHAIAAKLISAGATVYGSVRKEVDAEKLRPEFGTAFIPLIFDVTDEVATAAAAEKVRTVLDGQKLTGLVNNAGVAIGGPLQNIAIEDYRKQLEVNLVGPLIVTQAFLPLLGADEKMTGKPGRIINIGSVGGQHAFPFMAPYHVTKYGIEGFTESLRRELIPFGIDAILVAPGTVKTPIWDKGDAQDFSGYEGTVYEKPLAKFRKMLVKMGETGLPPERIADVVYLALTTDKPKTYYRITDSELTFQALTKLPTRWVDAMVAKQLALKPKKH